MSQEKSVEAHKDSSSATSSHIKCGNEAVGLLNCLAKKGKDACPAEMEAFLLCVDKAGVKEFVFLEECPATAPPVS
jgi:hypothetical protein